MNKFRRHTPKRRNILKEVTKHGEHREDLRADFQHRCGYCNDIDNWRFIWFEIDHFVPQKHLNTISSTDYSNLVYSCRSCNNAKRAKWPSEDENIHNDGNIGFIDPCDDDYNNQFDRLDTGRIIFKTNLGEWMYNAMKLYKPQHEIIWNIEQLHNLIKEIRVLVNDYPQENGLKNMLITLYNTYDDYIQRLFKH
jgi:uncharacterized protein (TIGR02646 family)